MDNQSLVNGQLPQFDPAATPPPPIAAPNAQPGSPGSVVEPTSAPTVADDTLAQLEQNVNEAALPDLPPPPFEEPAVTMPNLPIEEPAMPATTILDEPDSLVNPIINDIPSLPMEPEAPQEAVTIGDTVTIEAADPSLPVAVEESALETEVPEIEIPDLPISAPIPDPVMEEASAEVATEAATPVESNQPAVAVMNVEEPVSDGPTSVLDEIKQEALKELAPIADQLDQPPDERFNTLFELIQATDNHDLVKPAFQAANQIEDQKSRANALLNIVNEVNYLEKKEKKAEL